MSNIKKIKKAILRQEVGSRGGGVEISLDTFGFKGQKMSAYQNHLGGGMLGAVASDCTVGEWRNNEDLKAISEELKEYFHNLTNPDDEWEGSSYEENQNRSVSVY